MKKKKKTMVGAIIIVILVIIITVFIATEYNSYRRQNEYTPRIERVTTELGDEFGVHMYTVDFPEITNYISILDTANNKVCSRGIHTGRT